jgi:Ca2+-binding RTX toxin-like protein
VKGQTIMSFIASDSTVQVNLKLSNNIWVLEEGANLVTNLNAMDGSGSWSNREIFVNGNVMTGLSGMGIVLGAFQNASSDDLVSVGKTGSIYAGQIGILAYDNNFTFHNDGIVHAGAVADSSAQAVSVSGSGCRIENTGTISVDGPGLALSLQSGPTVVTNSGLIEANNGAAIVIGGGATVVNAGAIIGGSEGEVAIETVASSSIHNTGTIIGKIMMGNFVDYFHTSGGTIDGSISLGGGDDQFYTLKTTIDGTVYGGLGDDTYHVDDAGVPLLEYAGQGSDTVYASLSYRLGANIENLRLTGHAALSGTGNSLDNVLAGNDAANLLDGGRGIDTADYGNSDSAVTVNLATGKGLGGTAEGDRLHNIENLAGSAFSDHLTGSANANILSGDAGNDVLTGLGGKDIFYFADFSGKDTVLDFTSGQDRLQIKEFGIGSVHAVKTHMSQHGSDVVIDFSAIHAGDELVIRNMHKADFHAADFLLI